MSLLEAQEEAEAWEEAERERAAKDAEIARLRAALKPFAEFAAVFVQRADRAGTADDIGVTGANDVTITLGQCRAALKALE